VFAKRNRTGVGDGRRTTDAKRAAGGRSAVAGPQKKLGDPVAEQVVPSREEAALCLGLVNGLVENLETEQRKR
jgi:hypothetical protein